MVGILKDVWLLDISNPGSEELSWKRIETIDDELAVSKRVAEQERTATPSEWWAAISTSSVAK